MSPDEKALQEIAISIEPHLTPGARVMQLGAKPYDHYLGKLIERGFDAHAIDLNAAERTLPLDLCQPLDLALLGSFDLLTNFGCTEHVFDQAACWSNIHNLMRIGGRIVSMTPYPGDWARHGRWYPRIAWYEDLARKNHYTSIVLEVRGIEGNQLVCWVGIKREHAPFVVPNAEFLFDSPEGKVGKY